MADDELTKAQRRFRLFLDYGCDCNHFPGDELEMVLDDYNRRTEDNARLSELLRESARRTIFWRDILRSIAPGAVLSVLADQRWKRRHAKGKT